MGCTGNAERSDPVLAPVPGEMSRVRAEPGVVVEMEWFVGAGREQGSVRRAFGEPSMGEHDQEVVALGDGGPESLVEHPVGVGC